MDSRAILPVIAQYAIIVIPIVVTLLIAYVGQNVAGAAKAYNTHVTDAHVRAVVESTVKQAEMLLGGNSVAKRQQVLDRLSVLLPWLSHADASRLIEAAVLDLNQFQALTTAAALTGGTPLAGEVITLPAAPPQVLKLQIEHTLTGPAVMSQNPASPTPPPEGTTLPASPLSVPLGGQMVIGGGQATVTASSTTPETPPETPPGPPLPQG